MTSFVKNNKAWNKQSKRSIKNLETNHFYKTPRKLSCRLRQKQYQYNEKTYLQKKKILSKK